MSAPDCPDGHGPMRRFWTSADVDHIDDLVEVWRCGRRRQEHAAGCADPDPRVRGVRGARCPACRMSLRSMCVKQLRTVQRAVQPTLWGA